MLLLAVFPATAQAQNVVGATPTEYTLRPGDVLQIIVWGQAAYSGQFKIDETGRFQYPVLGELDTNNKPLRQIRDELRTGLAEIFNQPFVTISPQFNIAVLGEVNQPGLFAVDPTLTVLDIVAMAGGPSPNGNINNIRLMRAGQAMNLSFQADRVGARTLQDVGLQSGDQIMVPRRGFTGDDLRTLLNVVQVGLSIAIVFLVR
jgi:polysaccharide export outer membrane protein